jgi:hypothetical protein
MEVMKTRGRSHVHPRAIDVSGRPVVDRRLRFAPSVVDRRDARARRRRPIEPHEAVRRVDQYGSGGLVDEAALVAALSGRRLRGAALDVFTGIDVFAEPGEPPDHPLCRLDNVILTPHCAGSSVESSFDSKRRGARNAALVLEESRPEHIVNPKALAR